MKKKLLIVLIGIIVSLSLMLIWFLLIKELSPKEVERDNYLIHYDNGYYVYDIETKKDGIYVEKSEVVHCIQTPCKPLKIDSFKVEYEKEYQDLMENLFQYKNTKEITITNSDLSDEEIKIISSIIKEKLKEENTLSYNIIDSSKYNSYYSQRGYYVKYTEDNKVMITVAMGMQRTGGYNISIAKVNIIDDGVQIYVKETYPFKDAIVTDALTYPIVQIEFNKMPKYIMVQSLDSYQDFPELTLTNTY